MILSPSTIDELCAQLKEATHRKTAVERVDLSSFRNLVEHVPEDMTATVEAGMSLAEFQKNLGKHRQWLPIDPPFAESITIGHLLAHDLSGPRRLAYGTIRDHLIGIKVALPGGELIKSGGKVVKNVAGYDLGKLFIGSKHSLGIIVEATFKLRPMADCEKVFEAKLETLEQLEQKATAILQSAAQPIILDAHNLRGGFALVVGFAGTEEEVNFQMDLCLGEDWAQLPSYEAGHQLWESEAPPRKISVLPTRTPEFLRKLGGSKFLAHYGNGVIFFSGSWPGVTGGPELPIELMNRLKRMYDPAQILPQYNP